jgi:hypothetical protein
VRLYRLHAASFDMAGLRRDLAGRDLLDQVLRLCNGYPFFAQPSMINFFASDEASFGFSDSNQLMVASGHRCGSGSSLPDLLSFFSPRARGTGAQNFLGGQQHLTQGRAVMRTAYLARATAE